MNSLIDLRECQTPSRWHSFRMLSRTFPSSALVKLWMNTLPPPLGMGHSLTSITHPTTTSSSMYVLGMMPPTHQPFPREVTEFCQTLQVQSHLEMPRILVQLGHIQRT